MAGNKVRQNLSSNGDPIQALMPLAGGTEEVTDGNESQPITGNVVRILATSGTPRVRFGATGITATSADIQLIEGIPEYFSIGHDEVVAVVDGTVEVTSFVTPD